MPTGLLGSQVNTQTTGGPSVSNWYKNALNRDPDKDGLAYWNSQLASGRSAESVYGDFMTSANTLTNGNNQTTYAQANATPTAYSSPQGGSQVDEWFRNTLGREATGAEMTKYGSGSYETDWNSFYGDYGSTPGFKATNMYEAADLSAPGLNTGLLAQPTVGTTNSGAPINTGATLIDPLQISGAYAGAMNGVTPLPGSAPQIDLTGAPAPGANAVDIRGISTVKAGTAVGTYAPDKVQTYQADKAAMTDDMLVNNQLNKIIRADNPLMQSARTSALQQMNGRGLLNSSMSAEAAQKAVIDSALPIAQQDANTHRGLAEFNTTAENKAREFAATAQNTRDIENAKLATEVELQNVRNQLDADMANQDAEVRVALQNSQNALNAQIAIYEAEIQARTANAQMQNQQNLAQYSAQMGMAGDLANALSGIMQGNQAATNAFNNMSSQQQFTLQQNYNTSMSTTQNWAQTEMAKIQSSDATEEQKSAAFTNIQSMRDHSIKMTNALYQSSPQWSSTFAMLNLPTYS